MKQLRTERSIGISAKTSSINIAAAVVFTLAGSALCALAVNEARRPDLPSPLCDGLQVPDNNHVAFHVYAEGVQIYRWSGTAWVFIAPAAALYADANHHGQVGIHYLTVGAGPTWENNSGSKVIGMRLAACTPDTSAIPWLKLGAISSNGPGVLEGVSFVQRVNTVGGLAPSTPGTTVGQEADVPYTAEYFFYRAPESTEQQ